MSKKELKAIVLAAPSGSGKTTLRSHLTKTFRDIALSVSCTTRDKRENETHGKDYYFISLEEFNERIGNNEFIEYEEVYEDTFYGTTKREIRGLNRNGNIVIFDVDVIGALNIKKFFGNDALSIFIDCDPKERERRLRGRGTEKEADIKKRLAKAEEESSYKGQFDVVLANYDLDQAKKEIEKLVDPKNTFVRN